MKKKSLLQQIIRINSFFQLFTEINIIKHIFYSSQKFSTYCYTLTLTLLLITHPLIADTISDTNKYAWSENAGWLNFKSSNEQVSVFNDHLEGYVWAAKVGWIRLGTHTGGGTHTYTNNSAGSYGVNHDGSGNLSGYAWGENIGWVNFNPTHSQVTLNTTTGDFNGYAWSEKVGWIHFQNNSPAYKVQYITTNSTDDTTPDAFSFTDQSNVNLTILTTSNAITVSGINTNAVISISGGEYEINGSGTWTSTNGIVANTNTVKVRHTSSGSNSTAVNSVLTIGGMTDTFSTTTKSEPVVSSAPAPVIPVPEKVINLSNQGVQGGSVLGNLQKTKEIVGENNSLSLTQDSGSTNIQAKIGERTYELKPIEVTQAPEGTQAGIYITIDGTIQLVSDSGNQVTLQAEPKQLAEMIQVFEDFGLTVIQGDFGALRFNPQTSQRSSSTISYSARVSIDSLPVADSSDTRTGLISIASTVLANTIVYAQQFYENNILYRQYLYPTPADWEELKTALNLLGTGTNIDLQGIIEVTIGDINYRALMDYRVLSNAYPTSDSLSFIAIADQNNDGSGDYEVVYANGDMQVLYILP